MPFILEFIAVFEFRFASDGDMLPVELFLPPVFEFIAEGEDVAIGAGDAEFELVT